jgi:RNA polymerase sigma factor (sigma-70 family)
MAIVVERRAAEAVDRFDALFAELYADLYALVFRVLGDRMESEDVLQEAFLKLADQPLVQMRSNREVAAWLRRVGLNLAFNQLRSERRSRARLERVARLAPREAEKASDPVESDEEQAAVRRALAELPERQRECLLLRHSGYSYAEIAATLEIAIGSVGVLLSRAERAFSVIYRRHAQA